ncbi:hypothetical protein DCS_07425 [Drechmeria coniospora]|uniref:Glutaredoxin domain-containing protein n=1 Tax=Drechmeria coniospora TaxID=98403 RepID=A0A151GEG9_DRECN|nr:hypothetical protein DCS_07425 [Drechmeria coniospora]KYK55462.1 hypothetical protein DCS_07425 [Drechmeria coniospora]
MPSPRRLRLLMLAAALAVFLIIYYSSGLDSGSRDASFYHKTVKGMNKAKEARGQVVVDAKTGAKAGHIPADKDADGDVDADDDEVAAQTRERLKQAEKKAKDNANEKALRPDPPSEVVGKGNSAEGQVKKRKGDADANAKSKAVPEKSKEEHDAELELNNILQQAPVVIFSKSYCPFSKRAKGVLLEKYTINPPPHVVELDEHPLGRAIQNQLFEMTGRRTVPNVMINGVSIGGGDDIVQLDDADTLAAKIRELGSDRVSAAERFVAANAHAAGA